MSCEEHVKDPEMPSFVLSGGRFSQILVVVCKTCRAFFVTEIKQWTKVKDEFETPRTR